jgi:hypothetical protein
MGFETFLLLVSLAGFYTFACGTLTGILLLYDRTTFLHHFAFCVRVFTVLSRTLSLHPTKHGIRPFVS